MTDAEDLVTRFAAAWGAPRLESFLALFTDDVRLEAPLVEPTIGRRAASEEFARLLWFWPEVRGHVARWALADDYVYIDWSFGGAFRGVDRWFPAVDRIRVRDGLIAERVMYADGLQIAGAFMRDPRNLRRIWRSGLAPTPLLRRITRATTSRRRFDHASEPGGAG